MVKVIFYNLLRSKYGIKEEELKADTINGIIEQILAKHKEMKTSDFTTAVVFREGKPIHKSGFFQKITDGEEIIITHFVGGG